MTVDDMPSVDYYVSEQSNGAILMNAYNTFKTLCITAALCVVALAVLCLVSSFARAAPVDLAQKYRCDDNQIVSINYALGAPHLTFDGTEWSLVLITDGYARRENGDTIPTKQYEFQHGDTSLFFITGEGAQDTGALLLPNSDDLLFCEVVK